jgi:hypothetical protein
MGELLRAASEEEGERGQYIREHWTVSIRWFLTLSYFIAHAIIIEIY